MIDDIRDGIKKAQVSVKQVAEHSGLSERTVYNMLEPGANPTIGTIRALATSLSFLPDPAGKTCRGCVHAEGFDNHDGCAVVLCGMFGGTKPDNGCCMRRAKK